MPSFYTHKHFSKEVKNKLNLNNMNNKLYEVFSQSFDFLFYYNFPSIIFGKKIRDFGKYCHRHNCQEYILNIAKYIKEIDINNKDLLAYLYGSINHYALDSTMHPYINFLAKKSNKIGEHTKIEFNIDAYYYYLDNSQNINNYKIYNDMKLNKPFSSTLITCINKVYEKTYNYKNMGYKYFKGIKCGQNVFKYLIYDPSGHKKKLYKKLDLFKNKINYSIENCSLYIPKIDKTFLNEEKFEWNNISNINKKYNYSWNELYKKAIETSVTIIKNCNNYLLGKIDINELANKIPNMTYSNGNIIKK